MAKLHLAEVTYAYSEEPVVRALTLSLESGRFYGVVGPNGAGKSTLLKLMDGYIRPQQGVVYLNGRDLRSYSLAQLAREIALIPQTSYYFPFTVEEMVLLGRTPFYSRWGAPSAAGLAHRPGQYGNHRRGPAGGAPGERPQRRGKAAGHLGPGLRPGNQGVAPG